MFVFSQRVCRSVCRLCLRIHWVWQSSQEEERQKENTSKVIQIPWQRRGIAKWERNIVFTCTCALSELFECSHCASMSVCLTIDVWIFHFTLQRWCEVRKWTVYSHSANTQQSTAEQVRVSERVNLWINVSLVSTADDGVTLGSAERWGRERDDQVKQEEDSSVNQLLRREDTIKWKHFYTSCDHRIREVICWQFFFLPFVLSATGYLYSKKTQRERAMIEWCAT